jgi:hypothetical protein
MVVQLRLTGQSREDVERVLNDIKRHYGKVMHVTSQPRQGRKGEWLGNAIVVLDEGNEGEEEEGYIL